jgi:predicted Zn-dependent peptidase
MNIKHLLFSTFALVASASIAQEAKKIEFEEFDLDNGMHVILHEDHSTPIVAVSIMYHVGSKNEKPERTGFAHFFEHLLFEGSKHIKRGDYDQYVEGNGGVLNANTSQDRTFYYELLPSNQLELGLWLESERLLHAKVENIGIETQRQVVKEEKRQRNDNQPYGSLVYEMMSRAFTVHPYKWQPIGSMDHLDAAQEEDYVGFYRSFYVPNNAVLSIAGDLDKKQAKEWIKKYFSTIPTGEKLNVLRDKDMMDMATFVKKHGTTLGTKVVNTKEFADDYTELSTDKFLTKYFKKVSTKPAKIYRPSIVEPELTKEVRDTIYDEKIQLPGVVLGYRMPAMDSKDFYAVQLLNSILSGGNSSRMNKSIVEKDKLALFATSFPFPLEDPGIAMVLGIPGMGVAPDKLEDAMNVEIAKLQTDMVSDRELQKVKNQMESNFVNGNAKVAGIAETLANNHMYLGDANLINTEITRYLEVTKEDIQRVAKKYYQKDKRVVLYYLPKK